MEPPTWALLEVQKRPPSPALSKVLNAARAPPEPSRTGQRPRDKGVGWTGPERTAQPLSTAAATERQPHPCGRMSCPLALGRAALLLSLCLLPAAAPLSLREEAPPGDMPPSKLQVPETDPDSAATPKDSADDLFPDVEPKALAALLLQALRLPPPQDPEPSADEEKVRSETRSSGLQREGEQGWEAGPRPLELESLRSVLHELQGFRAPAKREEPAPPAEGAPKELLQELEEAEQLRAPTKRKAPPGEPWEGARKLRQQQHLEHQLLQRRYEELAESRRQAEEARRAAAEEERLADMASDLLLQYLLKDGEGEESQEEGRPGAQQGGRKASSALLFEDEEGNVAEDKRSNEAAPEEEEEEQEGAEDEDIDPNTIDRLIELSSKLHLPANDVIDIINDVEKKKKEEVVLEAPRSKGKAPPALGTRGQPKKAPPYPAYAPGPKPLQKPHYPPARQPPRRLPKADEDAWNEVLRGDEYPPPKWFRAQPDNSLSNYISPRTFQPPASPRYAHLPGPLGLRDKHYGDRRAQEDDDDDDEDEQLENYIERVLRKRPQGF